MEFVARTVDSLFHKFQHCTLKRREFCEVDELP